MSAGCCDRCRALGSRIDMDRDPQIAIKGREHLDQPVQHEPRPGSVLRMRETSAAAKEVSAPAFLTESPRSIGTTIILAATAAL